jgi:voltage-gated sodium channel
MLNLFIAIIVNAMQTQTEQETEKTVAAVETATHQVDVHLHADIKKIEAEIRTLREIVEKRLGG